MTNVAALIKTQLVERICWTITPSTERVKAIMETGPYLELFQLKSDDYVDGMDYQCFVIAATDTSVAVDLLIEKLMLDYDHDIASIVTALALNETTWTMQSLGIAHKNQVGVLLFL
jgi:hypothetical protein